MQVVAGIDVGGTNTKLGLITREGKLIAKKRFLTQEYPDPEMFIKQLISNIEAVIYGVKDKLELVGIGVGSPMANYHTGIIEGAANLGWNKAVNLQEPIARKFNVLVRITNDANLAAMGEKAYGAAVNMANFLSVTIGTGLGCGVFCGGDLQHGENDLAGELGHTSVDRTGGRKCSCGKSGCLETYVSARGLVQTTDEILSRYKWDSSLRTLAKTDITPKIIDELARKGDSIAIKVLNNTGDILGYKLADVIALYNPEAIFLTGGIANCQLLFEPTLQSINKHIYNTYNYPIKLLRSALNDDEIAVMGAGALVWRNLIDAQPVNKKNASRCLQLSNH